MIQTPLKRVLFGHTLKAIAMGVFSAFIAVASLTSVISLNSQTAVAATSRTLNFQARLLNSAGAIVPDGTYNIEFKLYDAASGGTLQWTETRYDSNGVTAGNDNRIQVKSGYVNAYLGDVNDLPSNIWNKQLWLTMNIGGLTQTATPTWDGEMNPRLRLTAVPSAYSLTNYNSVTGFSSSLAIAGATGGDQEFVIPDQGAAGTYSLLTTTAANAGYVQFAPASVQADASTNNTIFINKTGASGNIVQLQKNGVDMFTVSNAGALTVAGAASFTGAGTGLAVTNNATVGGTLGVTGNATVGGVMTVNGAQFTNNGATLNTAQALSDFASGGTIGTAAATVDIYSTFTINQTTAGQTLTLPSPTSAVAGRLIYIANIGSQPFTMHSVSVQNGKAQMYIWNGTAWTATNIDGAGSGVTFVGGLNGLSKTADGAAISGNGVYLQTADATYPGLVSVTTQTFAGDKTFNGLVTGGAGLTVTGGAISLSGNAASSFTTSSGNLSLDSAAVLNVGTSSATSVNIGRTGVTTTNAGALTVSELLSGSLGATISGATINLNNNSNFATNINTGTSTGAISIGNSGAGAIAIQSGSSIALTGTTTINTTGSATTQIGNATGTFQLDSNTLDISSAGALSGITDYAQASGNFLQSGAGTFGTGTGAVSLNGAVTASSTFAVTGDANLNGNTTIGNATTDRLTITAQLLGATPLAFQGATDDAFTTSFAFTDPTANNTITFPNTSGTVTLNPASGSFIRQVPTSTAENTVTPTANSVVGLTLNGTSGTAAAALNVVQTGAAGAILVTTSNGGAGLGVTNSSTGNGVAIVNSGTGVPLAITSSNSGTQANAISVTRNASGTTTNLLSLANGGGTVTNGIIFSGTYTNLINGPNFNVSNAGAVTAVGVDSGTGLIQGTGGLTLTGTAQINATGSSATTIGNASAGTLTLQGNASSTIVANSGANATTLSFTTPTGARAIVFPDASGTVQLAPASGSFIRQVPTTSAENTITPTANSVVGLTVNGTSGTAATAASIVQGGAAVALGISSSNNTATDALGFSGTFTNLINSTNFDVSNAGTISTNGGYTQSGSVANTLTGSTLIQTATNSTTAFEVKDLSANAIFGVDTTNRKVVIGAYTAGQGIGQLMVQPTTNARVGISIVPATGSTVDAFQVYTAGFAPAGASSSDNVTFRISETGVAGSPGSSTASTRTSTFKSGDTSFAGGSTGQLIVQSGANTNSGNTGALTIQSGNATSGNSGAINIDTGTATGSVGAVNINATSTGIVNIGNGTSTAGTVNIQGGAATSLSATNATGTTKLSFAAPSTAGTVTFRLPAGGTGGNTYDVCTTLSVCTGYQAAPASGSYIQQVPTTSADNTITPTANSVVGLTVNGTTGTAATALAVSQPGAAAGLTIASANNTATNGLSFSGTFTNLINSTNFSVSNAGTTTTNGGYTQSGATANTFTGVSSFTAANSIVLGTTGSANGGVVFNSSNAASGTITLQASTSKDGTNRTYTLPDSSSATDTICLLTLANCSGGSTTLQTAYTASTGGTTPEIRLDATRNGVDIQDTDAGLGSSVPLFAVRGSATASTLGTPLFTVNNNAGSPLVGIGLGAQSAATGIDLQFGGAANRVIQVLQNPAAGVGGDLTVQAGQANGANAGGALNLVGGLASATSGSVGGGVNIVGSDGNGSGDGGSIDISGGSSGSGNGGAINITGGNGTVTGGVNVTGGDVNVTAYATTVLGSSYGTIVQNTSGIISLQTQSSLNQGSQMFAYNDIANPASNLITPGSHSTFDVDATNTTGILWAATIGGETIAFDNTPSHVYQGIGSLYINTDAAANSGAEYVFGGSSSGAGTYTLSFVAKTDISLASLRALYDAGSGYVACTLNSNSVSTGGFQRYTCTFSAAADVVAVRIDQGVSTTARELYIDDVVLKFASSAQQDFNGYLAFSGIIGGATLFQNAADSTEALRVQNAAAGNVFNVDTLNGRVGINLGTQTVPSTDLAFGTIAGVTTARTIGVEAQTTSNIGGNGLTVAAGAANGTGTGGLLTLQGGAASATAGSVGGGVTIAGTAGTTTGTGGNGGAVTLQGGNATGTGARSGGSVSITAGANSATGTGAAGSISLTGGTANATNTSGGSITLQGGAGNGTQAGGAISLNGGTGGATGFGGALSLRGGNGASAGGVALQAGTATATGGSGGTASVSSSAGVNGSGATAGGAGGQLNLVLGSGGSGTGTNSSGGSAGSFSILGGTGGDGTGTGTAGAGTTISILAGQGGNGAAGGGAAGNLILQAGNTNTLGTAGGAVTVSAGGGQGTAAGGAISISSGGGGATSGSGGAIDIIAGAAGGTGTGAAVTVRAGSGGTTSGTGGLLTLQGGNAVGTNSNGGNVIAVGGTATGSGTGGTTTLQGGAAAAVAGSAGGAVAVTGAAGSTTGAGGSGGAITLQAGAAGGSGATTGGNISLTAGANSASGTGAAGTITLQGGATNRGTTAGAVNIQGGSGTLAGSFGGAVNITGGNGSSGGAGVNITTGTPTGVGGQTGYIDLIVGSASNGSGATAGGNAGQIRLMGGAGGSGTGTNSSGGIGTQIEIRAGNGGAATGTGTSGTGGTILIAAGNSGSGGTTAGSAGGVTVVSGAGANNSAGGTISLQAGAGNGTGTGGALTIAAGIGGATGAGGALTIAAGAVGASGTSGGLLTLQGGSGSTASTAAGSVAITAGVAGSSSDGGSVSISATDSGLGGNRLGGSVSITAGNSSGNQNGGAITLQAGVGGTTSGVAGVINVTAGTGGFSGAAGGAINITGGTGNAAGTSVGGAITVRGGTGGTAGGVGGLLTLQGGNAAGGNANGGSVAITGGTGNGTGVRGLVSLAPTNFLVSGATQVFGSDGSVTGVDSASTIPISASNTGRVITIPAPNAANQVVGRILYVANVGATNDLTILLAGTSVTIALKPNSTATLIWNGNGWTAAGASSSTDLQAAYNNTATNAGAAELILNAAGGAADGLTIRNNATTPIVGSLLEVQTSIGSNLFSVNNNATEYANNGGAETSTFTMWPTSPTGGSTATITRTTAAGTFATGQAATQVVTTGATTANQGVANTLTAALTANLVYSVAFTVKTTSNFSTLDVVYSRDGTNTSTTACATGKTATQSYFTRIECSFTAPASGITASNAIFIRQSNSNTTARTFYVDNLSVTINANTSHATDGSVNLALGSNWTAYDADGGAGTSTATLDTTNIYDTSGAVAVATTTGAGAGEGVRNAFSITPQINTQYLVTFYAKSSTAFSDITVGFLPAAGSALPVTAQQCTDYNTQTVSTTGFVKITCVITTPGSGITTPQLVIYQGSSAARTFYVDALTITLNTNNSSNVQIGGGKNGGPTTLFTLDRAASAPIAANNDAYLGSMYFDTTTGRIQCYEADGWGACGAAPDNIVNLNPEFPGAVLNGTQNAPNNVGTMNADFCGNGAGLTINTGLCASGEARNFYQWTSPQASQQTYSVYVTYQLPATFNGFSDDNTVQLTGRADDITKADVTYEMFKSQSGTLTQCGTGETDVTTTNNTWQTVGLSGNEATGCSFNSTSAGAFLIFKINVKAQGNANAYVGTLSFTTTNK